MNNQTKTSGTVNRGWLKKQIAAGNVEIKTDIILTDDYAFDASSNCQKSEWRKADISDFGLYDFTYKSGRAYWTKDGLINWVMLANHYYTCRLIK